MRLPQHLLVTGYSSSSPVKIAIVWYFKSQRGMSAHPIVILFHSSSFAIHPCQTIVKHGYIRLEDGIRASS